MNKHTHVEVLALIPARGGSKGIPRKNIKQFCGKPLMAWTIEEAKKSRYITRIVISTDDEEIAGVAQQYGAEAPFMRPVEIAGDTTVDLPVFEHALTWFKNNEGYTPDIILHLRVNSPLRAVSDIDRGIELMMQNMHADSIRAVAKAPLHPLKTYALREGNILSPFVPEEVFGITEPFNMPWQILPKAYTTGGYLSVIKPATILERHSMSGDLMIGFEVDPGNVIDIDTPMQFALAEILMQERLARTKT